MQVGFSQMWFFLLLFTLVYISFQTILSTSVQQKHLREFNFTVICLQVPSQMLKHASAADYSSFWSFDMEYKILFRCWEQGWVLLIKCHTHTVPQFSLHISISFSLSLLFLLSLSSSFSNLFSLLFFFYLSHLCPLFYFSDLVFIALPAPSLSRCWG